MPTTKTPTEDEWHEACGLISKLLNEVRGLGADKSYLQRRIEELKPFAVAESHRLCWMRQASHMGDCKDLKVALCDPCRARVLLEKETK